MEEVKINKSIFDVNNGKYENRLFIQFLLLVTLPLIVMGIISYNIYVRGESAKSRQALDTYCESVSNEYETLFSSIKEYYLDATSNSTFKWMVNQEAVPYSSYKEIKQAQNLLQGNYFMTKYISFYNFINVKEGWVLNKYGMYPYDAIKNKEDTDNFLLQQEENPNPLYWVNRMDVDGPYKETAKVSGMVDTSGELLIIKEEYNSGKIVYLLTVQLDLYELSSISRPYQKMGYDVTVISGGKVLMETNQDLTAAYLSGQSDRKGAYQAPSGKKYNMMIKESAGNGLIYVTGFDREQMKRDGIVFVLASLGIIVAFGVLLVILRLTAEAFSKPLLMMQKFVEDQNVQIKELFISNLVKGELNVQKIEETMEKYEMEPWNSYRMMGIICKTGAEDGEVSPEGKNRLNHEILNSLPESVLKAVFISPVVYEDRIIFLIGEDDDLALDNKTALVYKQVKDYVEETYHHQAAFGISCSFHKLVHTRRAYQECSEALQSKGHSREDNTSSLVLYDDYSLMDPAGNVYDIIIENELINVVDSCNEEEARHLLEVIVERLEVKGVSGIEWNFYITRLLTAVIDVPARASIPLTEVFDSGQYNIISGASQIYGQKELIRYVMEEIIRPVMAALIKSRQTGVSDIVRQVTRMVKESKGDITLNECADILSYHPNYISKVLKKEKGNSFTDMANEEKVKRAKYMLLTTEESIAAISEQLNYNNVQNFIRFFKNQVGITPSAFRKEHR